MALVAAVALVGTSAYLVVRNQDTMLGGSVAHDGATKQKVPPKVSPPALSQYTSPPSLEIVPPAPSATMMQETREDRPSSGAIKWKRPPDKGCNPPYTIDAQGIKKPKLQCL